MRFLFLAPESLPLTNRNSHREAKKRLMEVKLRMLVNGRERVYAMRVKQKDMGGDELVLDNTGLLEIKLNGMRIWSDGRGSSSVKNKRGG